MTPAAYASQVDVNPYALTVNAQDIWLLADITTFEKQTYTGQVHVGNNGSNGTTRLLVSLDPSISFNGPIDDTTINGHILDLRAVNLDPLSSLVPTIYLGGAIGEQVPLLGLNVYTGVQLPNALLSEVDQAPMSRNGLIMITGDVNTYSDQNYVSGQVEFGTVQPTVELYSETGLINLLTRPDATGLVNGSRLRIAVKDGTVLSAETLGALARAGLDLGSVLGVVVTPPADLPSDVTDNALLWRITDNSNRQTEFDRIQAMSQQSDVLDAEVKVGEIQGFECEASNEDQHPPPDDC